MILLSSAVLHAALLAGGLPSPQSQESSAPPESPAQTHEGRLLSARALATSGDAAQREQALLLYNEMLSESPGNTDVLLARGRTLAWMGRYVEAEADLVAVTTSKPGYADAWSALGDMYLWGDRPEEATDAYSRWLAVAPDDHAPLLARGRAHRAAGRMTEARADFAAAAARGANPEQVVSLSDSTESRTAVPDALLADGYTWSLRAGAYLQPETRRR